MGMMGDDDKDTYNNDKTAIKWPPAPDALTFNLLMTACLRDGDVNSAERLFDLLVASGAQVITLTLTLTR